MQRYPDKKTRDLLNAILLLKNEDEASRFFRDLLTPAEIKEFSKRFHIARELYKGRSYAKIAEDLGVSTTTVTRVALWLKNGKGGYKLVLERLTKK